MGLLTPKGKKDDKKNNNPKNNPQQSKFLPKNAKGTGGGFVKKGMTGGSQRGS